MLLIQVSVNLAFVSSIVLSWFLIPFSNDNVLKRWRIGLVKNGCMLKKKNGCMFKWKFWMKKQNTITIVYEHVNGGRNLCLCNVIFISNMLFWLAVKKWVFHSWQSLLVTLVYNSSTIIKIQARSMLCIWWLLAPHKWPYLLNLEDSTVIFHLNFCLWVYSRNNFLGCGFCCFNICCCCFCCFGYALLALFSFLLYLN